jgi:uncharacterized protein (TIGR03067 family)
MVRTLLVAVLTASVVAAAPVPKDFKKAPVLDGRWQVTAYESNGRPLNSPSVLKQTWAFAGEDLTITRTTSVNATPTKIKVRTDAKTRPMEFDYIFSTGTTRLGVFERTGDTLTISLAISTTTGTRPTNLDGGTGTLKYTLTRVKGD